MTVIAIHRVDRLELPCRPFRWVFAEERRDEIAAYFAERQAEKPALWNGRILLGRNPSFADGCFRADCFETGFADFLAWRDWGFPDPGVFNIFGMGALRGRDGAFVLGQMGAHTANAGRLYFPAGTPDPKDLRDGAIDLAASVRREVWEETGIAPEDYVAPAHWDGVVVGCAIALIRVLEVDLPGETLRDRINATLAQQAAPEFSFVQLVRSRADFTDAIPRTVTAFLAARFG
jgi:8-oxo-dGTP pyrophosphatase MutT (NUDIX family)